MTVQRFLVATALTGVLALPAAAQDGQARNVILMVSDGAGFNGWLAADYYQGLAGQQSYQTARPDGTTPVVYGLVHDSLNLIDETGALLPSGSDPSEAAGAVLMGYDPQQRWLRFENAFRNDFAPVEERYTSYTDSAAAGTTLQTGRKTANGRLNMDWTGEVAFETIAQIAMDRGMAAGAVSSVQVSHATPASVIAHNVSRNNYVEIFNEMIESDLSVLMGAGHPFYDNSGNEVEPEEERAYRFLGGPETVAALTSEEGLNGFTFIDAPEDFAALAEGEMLPERVVGIARAHSTLQASREGLAEADTPSGMAMNPAVPDLATMSLGALNVLNQDEDGFFVMIEGGAVDWMGHGNDMGRFIEEQIDFNQAVDAVIDWVEANSSWDETLLIVTSDHETGGIWGEGTWTNVGGPAVAPDRSDEALEAARFHPSEDIFNDYLAVQDRGAGNIPGHQWASRNHTNEMVPLWAMGPGAGMFAEFAMTDLKAAELWGEQYGWDGAYVDNTAVFHVMNEALTGAMQDMAVGQ
jgi:alkaline phosphatase